MNNQNQKKEENLWAKILSEAMSQDKLGKSNLILIGNRGSGKRTLVSKL